MGYFGKLEEKRLAIELRKKGFSYSEIKKEVSVSKDTLSRWCRDIVLSPQQLQRLLQKKLSGSEKGRIKGAKLQQQKRIQEIKNLEISGDKDVGKLDKRDRFLIGTSLYVAEGYKTDKCIGFSNSDPKLIKFMVEWFKEFLHIKSEKFRGAVWIHDNLDSRLAEKYWSDLTKIPLNQFNKTYISKNKTESNKIRKNIHNYGVFSIRISDAKSQRKILGWIHGITKCYNPIVH